MKNIILAFFILIASTFSYSENLSCAYPKQNFPKPDFSKFGQPPYTKEYQKEVEKKYYSEALIKHREYLKKNNVPVEDIVFSIIKNDKFIRNTYLHINGENPSDEFFKNIPGKNIKKGSNAKPSDFMYDFRIKYDCETEKVKVNRVFYCGPQCMERDEFHMEKVSGEWKVVKKIRRSRT